MAHVKGSSLPADMQRRALASCVHRYTRDHVPEWARGEWKDGKPYPVQFDSDSEWLANTVFAVTKNGEFSRRETYCASTPTWPDNPELRAAHGVAQ